MIYYGKISCKINLYASFNRTWCEIRRAWTEIESLNEARELCDLYCHKCSRDNGSASLNMCLN